VGSSIHSSIRAASDDASPERNRFLDSSANWPVALRRLSEMIGTSPQENASRQDTPSISTSEACT
jgi:hypothetical protein